MAASLSANPLAALDPAAATVVRESAQDGPGAWVGAPSALVHAGTLWLVYRRRRPRGQDPDRGYALELISVPASELLSPSNPALSAEVVWTGVKSSLPGGGTTSMERAALHRREDDGMWVLYVSYVDPSDGRWRLDRVEADDPTKFDLGTAVEVATPATLGKGIEAVKDAWIRRDGGGKLWMVVSIARATKTDSDATQLHSTNDAYNTGLVKSGAWVATSTDDGRTWSWEDCEAFWPGEEGWDAFCRRITCLIEDGSGGWYAPYDGAHDHTENYEERLGMAHTTDGKTFTCLSPEGAAVTPPAGEKKALRYFDCVDLGGGLGKVVFFECAREDGSHDMRMAPLACAK